jgi:2-polyprenyl-3-methyl-5-hydroxy-6-metoxy-1,4-benzoquinol methylase
MNQEKIWQHFQNEAPEIFQQADGRVRFLVRQLARRTHFGATVLNVGVGGGLFERMAIQQGMNIHSLDPDAGAIARLNANTEMKQQAMVGCLESVPFPSGTFDAVVVSEVLEHLSDAALDQALLEIHRVLGPRGLVIGTVPANENLDEQLTVCPCCGEKFHRWGHLQTFDEDRLRKVLSLRFGVQMIRENFFVPWSYVDWKGKTVCVLKNCFLRLGISWPGASLYFVAVKKQS